MNYKEEEELINNGFVELPNLAYDGSKEIFENLQKEFDKTYNSNTEFHNEYLKKHNILTDLKDSLLLKFKEKYKFTMDEGSIRLPINK